MINLIYHLLRYSYNYRPLNCQLGPIEIEWVKKFNLNPTAYCLQFSGCHQIKTFAHIPQPRDKRLWTQVCKQSKGLKTKLMKRFGIVGSHSLKYLQCVLIN